MSKIANARRFLHSMVVKPPTMAQMREAEEKNGWDIIPPGGAPYLPVHDWDAEGTVVSYRGGGVRILALRPTSPGTGAFRRLIENIVKLGYVPTLVNPPKEMRATLERWGWKSKRPGIALSAEEIWRPRKVGKKKHF